MKTNLLEKASDFSKIASSMPREPGVYFMKDAGGKIIYIGKAKCLRSRVKSYFTKSLLKNVKNQILLHRLSGIDYKQVPSEVEAFLLEATLIKKHKPKYNVKLKDDKSYPYIRCDIKHQYPRFEFCRSVQSDGAFYFGPYTSSWAVRKTLEFLHKTYKVRDCTDAFMKARKRPCLTYQMGYCTAPCVNLVSIKKYKKQIDRSLAVLRGQNGQVIGGLKREMLNASKELKYERAASLRDRIESFEKILSSAPLVDVSQEKLFQTCDVFSYVSLDNSSMLGSLHIRGGRVVGRFSHFIKEELEDAKDMFASFLNQHYMRHLVPDKILLPMDLGKHVFNLLNRVFKARQKRECEFVYAHDKVGKALLAKAHVEAKKNLQIYLLRHSEGSTEGNLELIQKKLHLFKLPEKIECYDISHLCGKFIVGSRSVSYRNDLDKSLYRKYKIKTVDQNDDYASMAEVLARRLSKAHKDPLPDLILVDGGKGQLRTAERIVEELGLSDKLGLAAVAKARSHEDSGSEKSEDRFFIPGRKNPIKFKKGMELLLNLRDEAHRFAINYHRQLRDKLLEKEKQSAKKDKK